MIFEPQKYILNWHFPPVFTENSYLFVVFLECY